MESMSIVEFVKKSGAVMLIEMNIYVFFYSSCVLTFCLLLLPNIKLIDLVYLLSRHTCSLRSDIIKQTEKSENLYLTLFA